MSAKRGKPAKELWQEGLGVAKVLCGIGGLSARVAMMGAFTKACEK